MRFEQLEDEAAVATAAADLLAETVAARRDARIILPAGKTPELLFAGIVARARAGHLDLAQARFFQLDEYAGVPPADARSFHHFLCERLLEPLGRTPEQDCLIDGAAREPRAEIERFSARLAELGGADLALLGIGRNGHVAFNEPGATLEQGARVVELASETRAEAERAFGRGRAPARGLTLGLREIHAARRIVLLATGRAKSSILQALFDEPASPHRPASLLLDHPDFTILADRVAAATLHGPWSSERAPGVRRGVPSADRALRA